MKIYVEREGGINRRLWVVAVESNDREGGERRKEETGERGTNANVFNV